MVVNEALSLLRGKLAAQVAHAAVQGFLEASSGAQKSWLAAGMPKVVVQVSSEQEVLSLAQQARQAGLPIALIKDAGKTVVAPGTVTCLCIGPAHAEDIDPITGKLELVR